MSQGEGAAPSSPARPGKQASRAPHGHGSHGSSHVHGSHSSSPRPRLPRLPRPHLPHRLTHQAGPCPSCPRKTLEPCRHSGRRQLPASALPAALAPCTPLIGRARSHGLQGRLGKRFLETRGRRAPCGGPTSSAQDAGQLCSAGVPSSHGHEGSPGGHLGLFNGLIANPNS